MYVQVSFKSLQPEQEDILIAQLADAGYEGFEEKGNDLHAFIPAKSFDKLLLDEIAFKYQFGYELSTIESVNWNRAWESNYEPVIVADFCAVRASFHEPIPNVKHEILITPKMSFGTGHHATTHMMVMQMRDIDFAGKSVFDFGTGTGILAILAEKLGASTVSAIDNDEWSIANASENVQVNACSRIAVTQTSVIPPHRKFDVVLANINRNSILENIGAIAKCLNAGGIVLVSGFLDTDEKEMENAFVKNGFRAQCTLNMDHWACQKYSLVLTQ